MPISVVFDPPLPSDSPSTFNTKAFTLLGDLNDWSTQANALPGEVDTNLTTLLASPPAIGSTTPAAVSATTLSAVGPITSTTTGTGVSGIKIYSTNVDAANRNWIIASNKDAYGDFHISQSNAAYGDAFSDGTSWLKISPSGAVTIPGSLGVGGAPNTAVTGGVGATLDVGVYGLALARNFSNNLVYYGGGWKYPKGNNGTASWLLGGDPTKFILYTAPQCTGAVDSVAPDPAQALIIDATSGAVTIPGSLGVNSPITLTAANPYISFVGTSATQNWRLGDGLNATNGNLVLYDYTASLKAIEVTKGTGAVTIPGSVGIGRAPTTKLDIFGVNQVVGIIQDPGSAGNSELKITSAGLSNYAALHFVSSGYIYDRTDSGNAICIGPDTVLANATAKFNTVSGVVEFTKGTFGYGTGAGGTVTQATDKNTTVTLHKPCGQIVLAASSIAAGGVATFQLTNSLLADKDVIATSWQFGFGGYGAYLVTAQVATGNAQISVRNLTGGALAETLVINFAIIKVATT